MRRPGYAERCEEWAEHRRRMAHNSAYREGWSAAMRLKVPASVLRSLERAGFGPGYEFDCEHQVRIYRADKQWSCQNCGEILDEQT